MTTATEIEREIKNPHTVVTAIPQRVDTGPFTLVSQSDF